MKTTRPAISLLVATVGLGLGNVAVADSFRGWRYSPPKGYSVEQLDDQVSFTRSDGDRFCSLSLFGPRRPEHSAQQEAAIDWNRIVTNTFATVRVLARGSMQTDRGMEITLTRAAVRDASGSRFGAIHYGLAPHGFVSSVLLVASSADALPRCEPAAKQFLENLSIDWTSPDVLDPDARTETPNGRWASNRVMLTATARSEYTLGADGTYLYRSTQVGEPETVRTLVERGTFTAQGDELALTPTTVATTLEVRGKARATPKAPLVKRRYFWDKIYEVDTNRWSLRLTPVGKNVREGEKANTAIVYPDAGTKDFPNM